MRRTRTGTAAPSRRGFLRTTAGAAGAAAALSAAGLERSAHAAGSDAIRVGLIGCGGRGTGAAINATNAGADVHIVALADLFDERLQECRTKLKAERPRQVDLPDDRCFLGFDAYEKLLASGVDVVILAATSHFAPAILEAAVAADKHVFCEKPHGIDVPGLKRTAAACELARARKLSLMSGLCWRYDPGVRETMQRVRDGAIGEVVAIQETYVGRPYIVRERRPGQTELEYQLWNWYHFHWLSGDQTAQQLVHSLDKASWALGDRPPLRCWGLGGRQTCDAPEYGDQYDHQAVVFEYEGGARVFGLTRDQPDCYNDTSDLLIGTKGRCDVLKHRIEGETAWTYAGPKPSMYDVEHQELFAAIRSGTPIDNSRYMVLSSALGVMAQIACSTGKAITWDELMGNERSLALPYYDWHVEPPVRPGPDGRYPSPRQGAEERNRWKV